MVARFQESRNECYSCVRPYQDRESVALSPRSRSVLEHNLEDEVLRAWASTEKYSAIATPHASGACTNRCREGLPPDSAQPYTCRLRDVDIGLHWEFPEMPRRGKSRLPSNILDTSW